MIDFFMTKKCKIYTKMISPNGAGDSISWEERGDIRAYIEPLSGEKLLLSNAGEKTDISLIIYTKNNINNGERVLITNSNYDGLYEIQQREFYQMPFFNYYKGYLVKTDENI